MIFGVFFTLKTGVSGIDALGAEGQVHVVPTFRPVDSSSGATISTVVPG
jgi:hypothetical protein